MEKEALRTPKTSAISVTCQSNRSIEWNIDVESYNKTVDKPELVKPAIKVEALKDNEMLELKRKSQLRRQSA